MIEKKVSYLGLDKISTLIDDSSPNSLSYFRVKDVPDVLTGGKNLFKIRLRPGAFKIGSDIYIEILDYNGNPIYYEYSDILDKDGESRIVSMWVYGDTPPGDATIYIAGTAISYPNGSPIPSEQQEGVNVKWNKLVTVAPDKRNDSEINFSTYPTASITEKIVPYLNRSFTEGSRDQEYTVGKVDYQIRLDKTPFVRLSGGAKFTSSMEGGTLVVSSPSDTKPSGINLSNTEYRTKIKKILSEETAIVDRPYSAKVSKRNKTTSYSSFGPSEYTMSYKASPEYTNTQNSMSYAKIDLVNLEPLTGDIYSVKTYRKSQGEVSDWKIVDTSELTANNLLVDNANNTPDNAIGIFTTQNIIDSHWELDNSDNSISGEVAMARSVDPVINSLRVELGQVIPEKQSVRLKTSQSFSLYSGGNYVLSFDAYSNRESLDNNLSDKSLVNVYMSGSAFDWKGQREVKGKRIDFLETYDSTKRWEDYEIEFQTNQDGQATLIFDIDDGMWDFSNIQLRSKQEPGYTPNHVSITVPIDTRKINDEIDFKFEYYDYKGNQCSYTTIVEDQSFAGGNVYIEGSANLLTGSLFVGNVVGKGIEQSGKNSGYIRSVGYPGWNEATASGGQSGFLMFSGSIGLGDAGNDYKGVGMEMVSGNSFFRYRTNPSALQIQSEEIVASGSRVIINTPTFFLGDTSNYISGSSGNIEISGSNVDVLVDKFFLGEGESQYISGSNGLLEISSSEFFLSSSGHLRATSAEFDETCFADSFAYRNLIIDDNSHGSLETYDSLGDTYYRLNLTGSSAAHFVRINTTLNYPIGEINVFNTFGGRGGWVILEPVSGDAYLASNKVSSSFSSKNRINFDSSNGDWAKYSFINSATLSATSYSNLYRIDIGDRAWLVRGFQDWKLQNASAYNSGPIAFKKSIAIDSGNAPSSAADTGIVGEIAWDSDYFYVCVATDTWKRVGLSTW